jgi:hypothetical protein
LKQLTNAGPYPEFLARSGHKSGSISRPENAFRPAFTRINFKPFDQQSIFIHLPTRNHSFLSTGQDAGFTPA